MNTQHNDSYEKDLSMLTRDTDYEQTSTVLNSMYNNCIMSTHSITTLNKYVTKRSVSDIMNTMIDSYNGYKQRVKEISALLNIDLKQVNGAVQSMAAASMRMKMLNDNSTEHAVSILVQGVYMGVIDMYKLLNNVENVDANSMSLARDLLSYHENSADKLKQYL